MTNFSGEKKFFPNKNKEDQEKNKRIDKLVSDIAVEQNSHMGLGDFLDNEGRINPASQDYFKKDFLKSEEELIDIKSNIIGIKKSGPNPVRDYYVQQYNLKGSDDKINQEIIRIWEKENKKQKSFIAEKMIYAILYKFLNKKFIIARSSEYDDYRNGVDFVIINKDSGSVVGAFDGLHDDRQGDRYQQKMNKVVEKTKKGGAIVKFGATIKNINGNKKVTPSFLKNIPIFYLPFKKEHLNSFKDKASADINSANEAEGDIFDYFLEEISKQMNEIGKLKLNPDLKRNLNNFVNGVNKLLDEEEDSY